MSSKLGGPKTEVRDIEGVLGESGPVPSWSDPQKRRERERRPDYPLVEYERLERLETWNERCKAILPYVRWEFERARQIEEGVRGLQAQETAAREKRAAASVPEVLTASKANEVAEEMRARQRKTLQRDVLSTASVPDERGRRVYGLIAGRVWLGERGGGELVASIQALLQPVLRSEQDMRRAQEQRKFAQEVAMYLFQNHGLMLQGGSPTFRRIEWLEIWEMTPSSLEYARAFAQGLTPGADEPHKRARDMTGRDISALVDRLGLKAPRPRPRAAAQTTHGGPETP